MRGGNERSGAVCKRSRASGAVVFSITPMRSGGEPQRGNGEILSISSANQYQSGTVSNIHSSARPVGTTRQHSKSNNVTLDSNRGGKKNNVLLAKPPEGNTRQRALRMLRKDRYEWNCVHCTQHLPSRWKRPLSFMATGIRLVLLILSTALDAPLEQVVNALWKLAFVSEKVKSYRRREDLSSPNLHTRGRDTGKQKRPARKPASSTL